MKFPKQAVILCGGLGTRMRPYTEKMPKPMVVCNKKPFLWHLLQQLEEQGIRNFVLLTGYYAEKIEKYFKNGSEWEWNINYHQGPVKWETARRLWEARDLLHERFMLLYSDNFVPFSLSKLISIHENNGYPITIMAAHKTPGNISINKENGIEYYNNKRENKLNHVEIGYMLVDKYNTLNYFDNPDCSLSNILKLMADEKQISAYVQNDTYYSISDPIRWKITEKYLKPKKVIFIERDGFINQKPPNGEFISSWKDFKWKNENRYILESFAAEGFKFIVITNQEGIALGSIKHKQLERIHNKMIDTLKIDNISILDIYVCTHNSDDNCYCRKPKPGMLYKASIDHYIRLDKSVFIGDSPIAIQAANNAGLEAYTTKLLQNRNDLNDLINKCSY